MDQGPSPENGARRLGMPDISRYREGNAGIDFTHRLEAAAAGPEVVVAALVHGNEFCGAHALDHLLRHGPRPRRGAVTAVFCNPAAALAEASGRAGPVRYLDEDMNRVWSARALDGARRSAELDRARELRPLIERADLLLDIHSMQGHHAPLMLSGPLEKGRRLALAVGVPATVVADSGHAAGPRMRDFAAFADPGSERAALLVECGQHLDPASAEVAVETLYRFLVVAGTLDATDAAPFLPPGPPPAQRCIQVTDAVTVETREFRFVRPFDSLETIAEAGTLLARDGAKEIRTPYPGCVLVMPARQPGPGATAVRLGRLVPA